jgi:hypothetical protein
MNITQIEKNIHSLIESINKETFIYELLLAYGTPKASISRLQKGNLNLSKVEGEIIWKKKLLFKTTFLESPQELFKAILTNSKAFKNEPRFIVVTDYQTLLAYDTKTNDKLEISLNELPKYFDFFLPWAGMEKTNHVHENPADVKAAEKMAKLFDEIKKDNPDTSPEFIHGLNVFIALFFLYGIYAAATEGISKAWISNITEKKDTATAIGTYSGFQSICTMLASSLAGLIWYEFGAGITFMVTGLATFLIILYFAFFTKIKTVK